LVLFVGAFSFFWHAIDRLSFRKGSETLRAAILDPLVFEFTKVIAEMVSKQGMKTTSKEALFDVQSMSLRYAAAPALIGTSPTDENCALWLAGYSTAGDTELPLTDA
jgi:hypothetical protein